MMVLFEVSDRMPVADAELMIKSVQEHSKGFFLRGRLIMTRPFKGSVKSF